MRGTSNAKAWPPKYPMNNPESPRRNKPNASDSETVATAVTMLTTLTTAKCFLRFATAVIAALAPPIHAEIGSSANHIVTD